MFESPRARHSTRLWASLVTPPVAEPFSYSEIGECFWAQAESSGPERSRTAGESKGLRKPLQARLGECPERSRGAFAHSAIRIPNLKWWARQDSNLHPFRDWILNPAPFQGTGACGPLRAICQFCHSDQKLPCTYFLYLFFMENCCSSGIKCFTIDNHPGNPTSGVKCSALVVTPQSSAQMISASRVITIQAL